MPLPPAPRAGVAGVLLALVLLAGCAVAPPDDEARVAAALELRLRQADIALRLGDPFNAAELLERAADLADGERAARLRLQAALVHLDVGDRERARELLERATPVREPASRQLATLVEAWLTLPQTPGEVVARLRPIPGNLEPRIEAWWLGALAAAHRADGAPLVAAEVLDRRTPLLRSGRDTMRNRERLWEALMAAPLGAIRDRVPARPDRFGAWIELAHALRNNRLDLAATESAVEAWRGRYPGHPAAGAFSDALVEAQAERLRRPQRIAVLLPLSGRLAAVGEAVQRGLLAGYYREPAGDRPALRFHDVGAEGRNVIAIYRDAQEWGADLVIGPLTKSALEQLSVWDNYPVPVLALNRRDHAGGSPGLYQFGLAPEDDALAAARLAADLGHRRVAALVPDSDWGDRVAASFVAGLHAAGGRTLEIQAYRPEDEDLGQPLRALFDLDASATRHRRVQGIVDRSLAFEPRRRQDMQAVFAAAFPDTARLVIPQVRFHHGLGLPVIATSHAYSGTPAPDADADMNGMLVVETPWVVGALGDPALAESASALRDTWADTGERYPRLAALGLDAYRLAGPVDVLALEPELDMPGASGRLSVDGQGRVRRALRPARMADGRLQPLEPPAAGEVLGLP